MQTKVNIAKFNYSNLLRLVSLLILVFAGTQTFATHNRAGEILYRRVSGFTYEITIVTYTKISAPVDRPDLNINWGDNTGIDTLSRSFEDEQTLGSRDVRISKYVGLHTYAGPGRFKVSVEDPNRNNNILNLKPENGQSDQVVFYIESILLINPFAPSNVGPHNNSSILLNPPIDQACLGQPYKHNPGAYDPDGDSLVYSLVPNRVEGGVIPPYYVSPDQISAGPNNNISINPNTGDLLWDAPQQQGQYNIAILIQEFRNGLFVGSVLRDMQITVELCDNIAPELALSTQDTCVIAGSFIQVPVSATDPDGDGLNLSATGLPFEISDPAVFTSVGGDGAFRWNTNCAHVRRAPYQVVVRAEDNDPDVQLVDFSSFLVRVLGPPVQNVQVNLVGGTANLTWDNYKNFCSLATAIKIYRRAGNTSYEVPLCTTGMPPELDYELIETLNDASITSFSDNNLDPATEYCYRLVACFADGSESVVSEETCTSIRIDIPAMTHVSIGVTDNTTGIDTVRWTLPQEIDTIGSFPPPYEIKVFEGTGFGPANSEVLSTGNSPTFSTTPTEAIFTNRNTVDTALSYRVEFFSNGNKVSESGVSSSIYLQVFPGDREVLLRWEASVNWGNYQYEIERQDNGVGPFQTIGTSFNPSFTDDNLENDSLYCYRIKAFGRYNSGSFDIPFINFSQNLCTRPFDNVPPCAPILEAVADCEAEEVILNWTDSSFACAEDIVNYTLYFKATLDGDFEAVDTYPSIQKAGAFIGDNSIAGCFYLSATDDNGNESNPSNVVCTENCPTYRLPDVITPNEDGFNDVFRPFSNKFVNSAKIEIFNRWGKLVFETTDPEINWNGKYKNTQEDVADGTYFYVIEIEVLSLEGVSNQVISGYLTLLR